MNGAILLLLISISLIVFAQCNQIQIWEVSNSLPEFQNIDQIKGECHKCDELEPSYFRFVHYDFKKNDRQYVTVTVDNQAPFTCIKILTGESNGFASEASLVSGGIGSRFFTVALRTTYQHISTIILAYTVNCKHEKQILKKKLKEEELKKLNITTTIPTTPTTANPVTHT